MAHTTSYGARISTQKALAAGRSSPDGIFTMPASLSASAMPWSKRSGGRSPDLWTEWRRYFPGRRAEPS